jgi:hypothetical protein
LKDFLTEENPSLSEGSGKNFQNEFKLKKVYNVSVEVEDFLEYKDALMRAIDQFTSLFGSSEKFELSNEVSNYSLRLAKKNGMPNYDYPSILMTNSIKNSHFERISVVFEHNNILSKDDSMFKHNMTNILNEKTFKNIIKKKSCCDFCIII